MSNQEQESDDRDTRKSKRQRKPNQYYTAGINELKKITLKVPMKKGYQQGNKFLQNQYLGDEYYEYVDNQYSSGQERLNPSSNYRTYYNERDRDSWLPCILPNNRHVKLQIVIDSNTIAFGGNSMLQEEKGKGKEKDEGQRGNNYDIQIGQTTSVGQQNVNKKNQSTSLNLLSLFEQAIEHVKGQNPVIEKLPVQEPVQALPPPPPPKPKTSPMLRAPQRQVEQDKDGKVLSAIINRQDKILTLNHSKLGQYEIPIDEQATSSGLNHINKQMSKQEQNDREEDLQKIELWKAKIAANAALLKNIDIFGIN